MNRRAFLAGLGGLGAGWPVACHAQSWPKPAPAAQQSDKPYWDAWKWRPSITAVAGKNEPQLQAIHQARTFWNAELSKLRTSFRLGPVRHVVSDLRVEDLYRPPGDAWNLPEPLRKIDGDIIVALSDESIVPSTTGWVSPRKLSPSELLLNELLPRKPSPRKLLIQIQSQDTYPMTISNAPRNVVAHELGHAIGLSHNEIASNSLICGSAATCLFQFPGKGFLPLTDTDKALLVELYPPDWRNEKPCNFAG